MLNRIICAGFGGQGVLTAGKIAMFVAYKKKKFVTWFPAYGNEMRGGSANCNVVISDDKIASPYCTAPDIVLALNEPCLDVFESKIKPGGYLFVNSSITKEGRLYRDDINVIKVPVTELAQSVKNERAANIAMLGAMINELGLFDKEEFVENLRLYFEEQGKGKYNDKNVAAFEVGYDYLNCQEAVV